MEKVTLKSFMKYGKHAGERIEDIPKDYLLWFRTMLSNKRKLTSWESGMLALCNYHYEDWDQEVNVFGDAGDLEDTH